jgi:hypothetical protein
MTRPESEAEQRLFNRHVQARSIVVEPALAVAFDVRSARPTRWRPIVRASGGAARIVRLGRDA